MHILNFSEIKIFKFLSKEICLLPGKDVIHVNHFTVPSLCYLHCQEQSQPKFNLNLKFLLIMWNSFKMLQLSKNEN